MPGNLQTGVNPEKMAYTLLEVLVEYFKGNSATCLTSVEFVIFDQHLMGAFVSALNKLTKDKPSLFTRAKNFVAGEPYS